MWVSEAVAAHGVCLLLWAKSRMSVPLFFPRTRASHLKLTTINKATIRPECSVDIAAIRQVNNAAFPTPAEGQLVDALRAAGRLSISLVAEHDGATVGHVAFSPVTLDGHADLRGGLGLAPVAVVPQFQAQGIGGRLIREALSVATAARCTFVVVLGEPAYYTRFGFVPATRFGLQNEYGVGDEFMALELQAGSLARRAGLIRYAPEFATLTT